MKNDRDYDHFYKIVKTYQQYCWYGPRGLILLVSPPVMAQLKELEISLWLSSKSSLSRCAIAPIQWRKVTNKFLEILDYLSKFDASRRLFLWINFFLWILTYVFIYFSFIIQNSKGWSLLFVQVSLWYISKA